MVRLHAPLRGSPGCTPSQLIQHTLAQFVESCVQARKFLTGSDLTSHLALTDRELVVVYSCKLEDYDEVRNRTFVFSVSGEGNLRLATLARHIGLLLGVGAHLYDARRVRSGVLSAQDDIVTFHEIEEAQYCWDKNNHDGTSYSPPFTLAITYTSGIEAFLRRVIRPVECLLKDMKTIVVIDLAINAVCHGITLDVSEVLRFSQSRPASSRVDSDPTVVSLLSQLPTSPLVTASCS